MQLIWNKILEKGSISRTSRRQVAKNKKQNAKQKQLLSIEMLEAEKLGTFAASSNVLFVICKKQTATQMLL